MRTGEILEVLPKLINAHLPVMLVGAPGVGKSEIVDQASAEVEHELLLFHPVTDEPIDVKGLPAMVDGQATFMPYGHMKQLLDATTPVVAFIDDLGQANVSVQASYMQMLLAREIAGHKISDNVTFISATNRKEDGAGVSGVLEPVKSRFVTIIQVEPNVDDWVAWALKNEVPNDLIAFIMYRPALLHDFQRTSEIKNSPCPRTVKHCGDLMKLGFPESRELELYTGAAGEGFATELIGFLKHRRGLPDPTLMLASPDKFPIPVDEPSKAYAMASAIAEKVNDDSMKNFCHILDRFAEAGGPEYSAMAMNFAVGRNDDLRATRSYIEWVSKNNEILV